MSNIDLLVQKLTAHESSQLDCERRAKELLSQAQKRVERFIELVEETLKLPASKKLLSLTHYHYEQEVLVEGRMHKVKLLGLKVGIAGKTVALKPMLQPWEGQVPVRFFLEGTKDDSRSIVQSDEHWELSGSISDRSKTVMDREGIAGLFVELF
jgi:hypothetical protein